MTAVQRQSTLTCPKCGHRSTETMPTDACRYFHEFSNGGRLEASVR